MVLLKNFLFVLISMMILISCSPNLSPLTQDIINEHNWSEKEFQQIQFYLSDDLVLTKVIKKGDTNIRNGSVKVMNGKKVEEIIIEEGTPGVFLFAPKSDRMAISFEEGGDKRYLIFGPNPNRNDKYVLLAKNWKNRVGNVSYDGEVYQTTNSSAYTSLLIDLKRIRKTQRNQRIAKGRKLEK